jgi:hypothetical protein
MKRAIVAFAVVAGMALMMTGCGEEPAPPKKGPMPPTTGGPGPATMPGKAPAAPPAEK